MLWDIESYIGNNDWNYITAHKTLNNKYIISPDVKIYNFLKLYNYTVEKEKEDLPFYDLENNIEFFDRLYKLIGVIPYIEKPENFYIYDKYKYNDLMKRIFERLNNFIIYLKCLHI